ncbi:MAG: protein kinase [Bryobacteraceae bacterium]
MSDPSRWKQVEALFEAAQQRLADQRAEFLRQACPDDPELCAEVESLLKAAESRDPLLDGSPLSSIAERPPALKSGDKLGNFQIVALIGRGGMGEVYRARDLRLKRDVAIKTLPSGFAADRDRIARFEREARAASALNHPNIVSVYDIGTEGGVSFIVSELVDCETLARLIQRGPLPLRKLIEVSTQICDGLAAAHVAGVIHRDLKPGNIMLTRDGRVKILDFGLARQDRAHAVDSTTMEASHPGMIMGTPGYMSPEQVRGEATDARSDIFSLGVILYEMASGKRAFSGTSSVEVMNSILKDEPPDLPPASPPTLDRLVRRCIEKQPERRFQSAADLGFALQPLSLSPKVEKLPKPRAWLKWAALAAAAVAGMGAALFWLIRPIPPPRITGTVQITNDSRPKIWPLITDGSRVFFNSGSLDFFTNHFTINEANQVSAKGGASVALALPVKNARVVDISPDRTELLVCQYPPTVTGCELWVAPVLGGSARRLGDLVVQAAAWSPDGQQLVYARDNELHIARSDGTEVRRLATLAGYPTFVRWSPDGSTVRLTVASGGHSYLWEARIDGNRAYPLLPGWNGSSPTCCGNWTPDGKYFVFQSGGRVTLNGSIWALREKAGWFRRTDRGPFQLTNGPLRAHWPVPSVDGKRLFIDGYQPRNEFLRYDLKSGQFAPEFVGTSGTDLEFSKDGKWVAYVSLPDLSVWRSAVDGSQRLQLTSPPIRASLPHWSPDGKQIAFFGERSGNPDRIYVVSFDGGGLRQVTNGESGKAGDIDPSWSPDGSALAFGGYPVAPASAAAIHVVDLKTHRFSTLPGSEGIWSPRWSPNGRFIAGLSTARTNVVLYDLKTAKQSELSSVLSGYPGWSLDGESLFYETSGDDAAWWRVRLRDRKTERVVSRRSMQVTVWFAPAPNNSLITARSVGTDEIYALDWEAP